MAKAVPNFHSHLFEQSFHRVPLLSTGPLPPLCALLTRFVIQDEQLKDKSGAREVEAALLYNSHNIHEYCDKETHFVDKDDEAWRC